MKTEVRNEFILEAHKSACNEWKLKIEKECPELFESKSGWYKDKNKENKEWLAYKDFETNKTYGINANGNWFEQKIALNVDHNEYPATEEEVKEALIKEAKKRGFKEGVRIKSAFKKEVYSEFEINNKICYDSINNGLYSNFLWIFKDGKWATIINPIEEKIKKYERKIEELKKQL